MSKSIDKSISFTIQVQRCRDVGQNLRSFYFGITDIKTSNRRSWHTFADIVGGAISRNMTESLLPANDCTPLILTNSTPFGNYIPDDSQQVPHNKSNNQQTPDTLACLKHRTTTWSLNRKSVKTTGTYLHQCGCAHHKRIEIDPNIRIVHELWSRKPDGKLVYNSENDNMLSLIRYDNNNIAEMRWSCFLLRFTFIPSLSSDTYHFSMCFD